MSKVYIIQEMTRMNYLPAASFGQIDHLTRLEFKPLQNSNQSEYVLDEVSAKLSNFDPSSDYIIMTGGPVLIGLVIHALLDKHGYVKVLHWDRQELKYMPFTLTDKLLQV